MAILWGKDRNLTFQKALAAGQVLPNEARAVGLLIARVDAARARFYCATGVLPVRGNLTGRIYLLRHGGNPIELVDGTVEAIWCISIGAHDPLTPPTDHVLVLRALVEGNEQAFREIGNASYGCVDFPEIPICVWAEPFLEDRWKPDQQADVDANRCISNWAESQDLLEGFLGRRKKEPLARPVAADYLTAPLGQVGWIPNNADGMAPWTVNQGGIGNYQWQYRNQR